MLSDDLIQRVAFVMADDLYKIENDIPFCSDAVAAYLRCTAVQTFFINMLQVKRCLSFMPPQAEDENNSNIKNIIRSY